MFGCMLGSKARTGPRPRPAELTGPVSNPVRKLDVTHRLEAMRAGL